MTVKLKEEILNKFERQIPLFHKANNINIIKLDSDYLIHNEMMLIRCTNASKVKWVANCHNDIINKVEILKNKIKVTEFDGKSYYLDKERGNEVP